MAIRNMSAGTWDYRNAAWSALNGGMTSAASECAGAGADTSGVVSQFRMIDQLEGLYGSAPTPPAVLMLFRETTFKIQSSVLDPAVLALFRGNYGQPLVEFATGLAATAKFQYRTGGTTYADTVTAAQVSNIDAVRIVADARMPPETGGAGDVTFGWSVNVALRNSP